MKRLIDAYEFGRKFLEGDGDDEFTEGYNFAVREYLEELKKQKTVVFVSDDFEILPEVRHGQWMFHEQKNGYLWKCSECKGNFEQRFSFCPHCGSKMTGA